MAPPTPVPAFAPSNPFAQPSSVEHGATPATPQPKHHPAGYPSAGTPSGAPQGYPGGGIPSNATTVPPHARAEHAYAPSPPQPPVYKSKGGRRRSHSRTSGASPGAQPSGNGTGDYRRSASSTSSYSDAGQSGHWHHRSASAASRGESADDGGFRAWQYDIAMEVFRLGQQLGSTELQVRQLQAELYAERVRSLNLQVCVLCYGPSTSPLGRRRGRGVLDMCRVRVMSLRVEGLWVEGGKRLQICGVSSIYVLKR